MVGCSARTTAAGFLRGASKYHCSSGRPDQIRALVISSSPNRKIGLDRPSTVSFGRKLVIGPATAIGLRASASSIGRRASSGVPL